MRHRRVRPANEFRYRLALAYVDLDELPELLNGQLLRYGFGALRFRRSDYLGDPAIPLKQAIQTTVHEQTGITPDGPIRVLTQLRSLGVCFNPVSFYYCFDSSGERLDAVVAEVTNTPWGERHAYVAASHSEGGLISGGFEKQLHVSPFMAMDHRYVITATSPSDTLSVHIGSSHEGAPVFDATLAMRRRELDRRSARWLSARYPLASLRVLALIYANALRLKLAGAPVFRHPEAGAA